jgi:hypothetical protein
VGQFQRNVENPLDGTVGRWPHYQFGKLGVSNEKVFKFGDDFPMHVVVNVSHGIEDGPGCHGGLIEPYLALQSEIHVHLRLRALARPWPDSHDLCAIFKRLSKGPPDGGHVPAIDIAVADEMGLGLAQPDGHEVQEAVLISLVEIVEQGQRTPIRSMVRLQLLDNCLRTRRDVPNPFLSVVPETLRLGVDRKLGLALLGTDTGLCGEGENEMVECRLEVEQDISDQETAFDWGLGHPLHPKDVVAGFRVELTDDFVGLAFNESLHGLVKGSQMVVRPI